LPLKYNQVSAIKSAQYVFADTPALGIARPLPALVRPLESTSAGDREAAAARSRISTSSACTLPGARRGASAPRSRNSTIAELRSAFIKTDAASPTLSSFSFISARDGCNISAAYGCMGSHRRRCSFSHIGGFGVINCATGSNASTGGGLPFHTASRKNLSYRSLSFAAVRGFDTREVPVRLLQIPCYRARDCLFRPAGKESDVADII
jgi:hypothetical protein